jgi:serine/threonine-protein kinase
MPEPTAIVVRQLDLTTQRRRARQAMHSTGMLLGDRYRLDDRIGAGGMGEVWRATDVVLGRTVAVKVVLPALLAEPGFIRRFLAEARAMASVRHRSVVTIHDYHGDADGAYLVMEYVEGEPLSHTLGRLGRLTPAATLELIAQAAEALQAAHDKGIVHRDVKPANLMVRLDGTIALTDFGIARAQDNTALTTPGGILGTPSYLAPEQVLGQPATPRSDVYALGVVAYECLAGRRPFVGDNPFAIAMQRVQQAPPPLDGDVPAPVVALVERALAADPALRWPSAAVLATAARRVAAGASAEEGPPAVVDPNSTAAVTRAGGRRVRSRRRLTAVVVLVSLATVLLGAVVVGMRLWGPKATPDAGRPDAATTANRAAPKGSVACGDAYCPPSQQCWGGLTIPGGVGRKPRQIDCAEPHYWETFVIGDLPADAVFLRQDELMGRADIASTCSEPAMAGRSRDRAHTKDWRREPWPVQLDQQPWVLYCLAGSPDGESSGAVFQPAAKAQ